MNGEKLIGADVRRKYEGEIALCCRIDWNNQRNAAERSAVDLSVATISQDAPIRTSLVFHRCEVRSLN